MSYADEYERLDHTPADFEDFDPDECSACAGRGFTGRDRFSGVYDECDACEGTGRVDFEARREPAAVRVRFTTDDMYGLWKKDDEADDLGPESTAVQSIRLLRLDDGQVLSITAPYQRGLIREVR